MKKLTILLSVLFLVSCTKTNQNSVQVRAQNDQYDIVFQNVKRLAAIHPVLQNADAVGSMASHKKRRLFFGDREQVAIDYQTSEKGNIIAFFLSPNDMHSSSGKDFLGVFFKDIPAYKQGVAMWRYKPWNSWSKPVRINSPSDLHEWDVQFYYWQYADGVYGAAMPMGGQGYRSTLGQHEGAFGAKAVSYKDGVSRNEIPMLAVGFSTDPYELFSELFQQGMTWMGRPENVRSAKSFPEPFNYLGWCTWNASDMGQKLGDTFLSKSVLSFVDRQFPLGWLLIDDGWFDHEGRRLKSLTPNPEKFPNGFKPTVDRLKTRYGVKYVGIWHALNGYWNGIDPGSQLGRDYADELFSWEQLFRPDMPESGTATYHFIKPDSDSLKTFYQNWHAYLKNQGFDFVKVDNQLVTEKMAVDNYPIFDLAESMHTALNQSVKQHFNGALINCMDMTVDAWANLGETAVARSVEDYFEYDPDETYDLQKGNAAAHVLQAVYNALYFGQMVYPDFDMFQSHHPNAEFHAIARAANNGPIYITDRPGQQNFELLRKLVLNDGRILRADTPLFPTEDCLFQLQDRKAFKAFSFVGENGMVAMWNCADADLVSGVVGPSDVHGIQGDEFALYDHFNKKAFFLNKDDIIHVKLDRLDQRLFLIVNADKGVAPLGLIDKYNALQTIEQLSFHNNVLITKLKQGGTFGCVAPRSPDQVFINNRQTGFTYKENIIYVNIPLTMKNPEIRMVF